MSTAERDTPTPRPWEATHFCKEDGTPIKTVEDVIETMGASIKKTQTPVLYGVTEAKADDYKIICYTGNGPKGFVNAQLIALASNRYDTLQATNKALLYALEELRNGAANSVEDEDWPGLQEYIFAADAAVALAKGET